MVNSSKKLPCGHIFHTSCLRSWFQRQQTCPTCRLNILRTPAATAAAAAAAAAAGAAGAAGAANDAGVAGGAAGAAGAGDAAANNNNNIPPQGECERDFNEQLQELESFDFSDFFAPNFKICINSNSRMCLNAVYNTLCP